MGGYPLPPEMDSKKDSIVDSKNRDFLGGFQVGPEVPKVGSANRVAPTFRHIRQRELSKPRRVEGIVYEFLGLARVLYERARLERTTEHLMERSLALTLSPADH
jgi:hypothetical protein